MNLILFFLRMNYVGVSEEESGEPVEVPMEKDGTGQFGTRVNYRVIYRVNYRVNDRVNYKTGLSRKELK